MGSDPSLAGNCFTWSFVGEGMTRKTLLSVVVVLAALVGAACGSSDVEDVGGVETAPACRAEAGSVIDVSSEPDWRQYADYREWTDTTGCPLRIDVVAERPGPEHCGWEKAQVLITGRPLGARYTSVDDTLNFVRDPEGVFGRPDLVDGLELRATVPAGAVDSGYRRGDVQLWHVPGEDTGVWLVGSDSIERWPEGDPPLCS